MGSHDNNIYVYAVNEENSEKPYKLFCKLARHSSFITSLDWSLDGTYLRTTDGGHERLFFSIEKRAQDPHGDTTTADKEWASGSIKIGADRTGAKPKYCDKTHINDFDVSPDGSLLVSADDYGLVNVFEYPVPEGRDGSGARSYAGHSEHVVRV